MSVENVSLGLVPQGQKASDYDNSDPVPPRQNVVPTAEKTNSSQQGLEFLFSPLLEEYYNPTHGQAEENNNDQAPNASFQEDEFINPFCTRVQEIGESSSRNIDNTDVHSFQPQNPEMCMFALTVSIVEPKNIKEAMADSAWIKAIQEISEGFVDPDSQKKLPLRKLCMVLKQAPKSLDSGFELTAFLDADHAGCIDTRKSTSGGIQFLGDKLVENGIIELYFVRTEYQLADMFTKALPEDRFKYLVRRIGMRCLTPAELEVLTNETA
ncbi:hypothetical protein Tco_0154144 [Tanacetum coccineum]